MKKYIGLDVGGTSIKYGVVDETGKVSHKNSFKTIGTKDELITKILDVFFKLHQDFGPFDGIGVSMPGVVQEDGFLTTAGAVKPFYGINLQSILEEKTELPVKIENDANAAAVGVHNYLSLVLGTGVGGGIVINDQIYRGAHARSGEFGWMIVEDDDVDVEMGSLNFRGATVIGLIRRYNQFSSDTVDDARVIFERAKKGEVLAQNVFKSYYHSLAKGIINLEVSFDPEVVIIGGGISANETFMDELNKEITNIQKSHNSIVDLDLPKVVPAKLKNDAGMVGAVYQLVQSASKYG